jgi:DHA1 family inner membrane transport protein
MAYLANNAVNRVNLHYGVQALAQASGGAFYLVFLLRAGLSIPQTFVVLASIFSGRLVFRPILVPLAKRFGLKAMLIAGAIGMGLQYPVLGQVHGVGPMLWILIFIAALGDLLYWPSFNAYFATVGDAHHRGHQVGAREALAAIAGVVAPLLAAFALITVGPGVTFSAVGLVQALSALPLLGAPNVPVKPAAPGAYRAARTVAVFYATDGWFDASLMSAWQIALYVTLKDSIPAYGGAMALAGVAGAACGLFIGPRIDAGRGRTAVMAAYVLAAAILVSRAASLGAPWLAVGANALGALLIPIISPTIGGAVYNEAAASPCPLRFQVMSEAGWDVGYLSACLIAAAMTSFGAGLWATILLGLPAVGVGAMVLWRLYAKPA